MFGVGEVFRGALAEIRLEECLRFGKREAKLVKRLDPQSQGTGCDIEHVPAMFAVVRQEVEMIAGYREGA
jgi:hypothetical protein